MEEGLHPRRDVNGIRIADGSTERPIAKDAQDEQHYSAILLFGKGDLEWWANDVGLPHWSSELVCGICLADKGPNNFKDFRRIAGWRSSENQ